MSKSAASRKSFGVRYKLVERGDRRSGDLVEVSGKSGRTVVTRSPTTGRFTTTTSAKAIDRTVVRYAQTLKRLAKR